MTVTLPRTFVDTNVLAYAHDLDEVSKRPVAIRELLVLWKSRAGVLSSQVLQEIYNVVTRKFANPYSPAEGRRIVLAYGSWHAVSPDPALILAASQLGEREPIAFWDALIVEAARRAGATRLLTEDLQDGYAYGPVVVENPFRGCE